MTKTKRFQPSTFSRWLVPYIIIVLVPICFGVLLHQQALRTVKQDVEKIQEQALEQRMILLEEDFTTLQTQAFSLANCREAVSLSEQIGDTYTVDQIRDSAVLQEKMVTLLSSYDMFSDISVYFPQTGYLLTGTRFCPISWSVEQLPREYGMTLEEILTHSMQRSFGFQVTQKYGTDNLIYFYSFGNYRGTEPNVLFLFQFDSLYMRRLLSIDGSSIYMELESGDTYLKESWMELEGIEQDYYTMVLTSKNTGFRLINWLPEKDYQKTVSFMKTLMLCYLIGCLVFGIGGVWFMTSKNYRPVQELRRMTNKMLQGQYIRDDVEAVKLAYQHLAAAYEREKNTVKATRSDVNNARLNQLLKQKPGLSSMTPPEDWQALCSQPFFVLMSIEILDFAYFTEQDGSLTSEMMDVAYFALENVLEELEKEEKLICINAQTDGICYSLINVSREQQEYIEQQIQMIAIKLQNFLNYQFHMPLSINISSLQPGWDNINLCYQEIQQLVEYRSFMRMNDVEVALYSQCRMDEAETYDRHCRKLADALEVHDLALAQKLFRDICEEGIRPLKSQVKEADKPDAGQLIDQIVAYIDMHYTENSLTVGFLADEYEIGLSWLSRNFKKYKDIGILEYINSLRLKKAKELICAGYPIRDVAITVGYTDTQPLNRMFRQMFGMSPTEYRSSME